MNFPSRSLSLMALSMLSSNSRLTLGFRARGHVGAVVSTIYSQKVVATRQLASGTTSASLLGAERSGDNGGGNVGTCVVSAALCFLQSKKDIVSNLSPAAYTAFDELVGASIGGHMRHALDHFAKCLAVLPVSIATPAVTTTEELMKGDIVGKGGRVKKSNQLIQYDRRTRGGSVEKDPEAALNLISSLQSALEQLPRGEAASLVLRSTIVAPAFMLGEGGGEGEHMFESNLERELFFCCHHGFHHDAMIRLILQRMENDGARAALKNEGLGVAPSTAGFRQQMSVEKIERKDE